MTVCGSLTMSPHCPARTPRAYCRRERRQSRPAPWRACLGCRTRGHQLYSEHSLHARLKELLAEPGDRLEVAVEGRVVDLVKAGGELVEVQTSNLAKIVPKVLALAAAGAGCAWSTR